jgi:hypothetical protein
MVDPDPDILNRQVMEHGVTFRTHKLSGSHHIEVTDFTKETDFPC